MNTEQFLSGVDEALAPVVPPQTKPITFHVSGLGERLLAYILDSIYYSIYVVLVSIALGLLIALAGANADSDDLDCIYMPFSLVISFFYYAYFWRRNGQTPGKKDMGIQIVRLDGQPITYGTALLRYIGYSINSLALLLGWLAALVDRDHRGWHDKLAGTVVVKKYVGPEGSPRQERGRWRPAIVLVCGILAMCGIVWLAAELPQSAARSAFDEAETHALEGDFDAAIADYSSAVRSDPNMTTAYVERGIVYSTQGHYRWAMADFDTALGLDPHCAMAHFGRGYVEFLQSDYASAVREFDEAVRLDPRDPDVYFYRGAAHSQLDDRELALADFREHVRLAGDNANPLADMMIAGLEAQSKNQ